MTLSTPCDTAATVAAALVTSRALCFPMLAPPC